jgi:hypothetical protein
MLEHLAITIHEPRKLRPGREDDLEVRASDFPHAGQRQTVLPPLTEVQTGDQYLYPLDSFQGIQGCRWIDRGNELVAGAPQCGAHGIREQRIIVDYYNARRYCPTVDTLALPRNLDHGPRSFNRKWGDPRAHDLRQRGCSPSRLLRVSLSTRGVSSTAIISCRRRLMVALTAWPTARTPVLIRHRMVCQGRGSAIRRPRRCGPRAVAPPYWTPPRATGWSPERVERRGRHISLVSQIFFLGGDHALGRGVLFNVWRTLHGYAGEPQTSPSEPGGALAAPSAGTALSRRALLGTPTSCSRPSLLGSYRDNHLAQT